METRIARGVYWIGDPKFCFRPEKWAEIVQLMKTSDTSPQFVISSEATAVIFEIGRHGDFKDKDENHYLVRSDFIGAVPFTIAQTFPENTNLLKHFKEKHFDCRFEPSFVNFGDQVIINIG